VTPFSVLLTFIDETSPAECLHKSPPTLVVFDERILARLFFPALTLQATPPMVRVSNAQPFGSFLF